MEPWSDRLVGETFGPMKTDVLSALRAVPGGASVLDALGDRDDVWVIGGAVRHSLLDRTPKDVDLVVAGDAHQLALALGEVRAVHDQFGTTTIDVDGATGRRRDARGGALSAARRAAPRCAPAALDEDLARRDFTVNAVAVALGRRGGPRRRPCRARTLPRAPARLHDASFSRRPHAAVAPRAYAARLGFAPEPRTGSSPARRSPGARSPRVAVPGSAR